MPARNRAPQRPAQRREQILTAAAGLFDDEGIGPVSVGKVAQAAGVSLGNLSYWFADKTEIVHALFDRWAAESAPPDDLTDPGRVPAAIWGREAGQHRTSQRCRFFSRNGRAGGGPSGGSGRPVGGGATRAWTTGWSP